MNIFAAIDVGSNAVRLMIGTVERVQGHLKVRKKVFVRIPLRLGAEVFSDHCLSSAMQSKLIKTMLAFRQIIDVFEPLSYRACATSAMRDADNGCETVEKVAEQAGIKLEIIDGGQEAMTVFSAQVQDFLDPYKCYLFIDVGGGSTELLLYANSKVVASCSFNVGTVRILYDKQIEGEWEKMQQWVVKYVRPYSPVAIGSGGNINRINRIAKKESKKVLSRAILSKIYHQLNDLSIEERMANYGLKSDRAEVIVPAGKIYLAVMEWGGMTSMHVPKFGLTDGLIIQQYEAWQ